MPCDNNSTESFDMYNHVLFVIATYCVDNTGADWTCRHGRPQEFFQGGANLWGGPKKICEGGPPYFFRQALKYAYRGGGV